MYSYSRSLLCIVLVISSSSSLPWLVSYLMRRCVRINDAADVEPEVDLDLIDIKIKKIQHSRHFPSKEGKKKEIIILSEPSAHSLWLMVFDGAPESKSQRLDDSAGVASTTTTSIKHKEEDDTAEDQPCLPTVPNPNHL